MGKEPARWIQFVDNSFKTNQDKKQKKTAKNTPSMMGKGRDYCGSNSVLEICKDFL